MDYPGKVITKNQVTPTQTSAPGVWTLDDAASAVKNNNWPVAGVPNPISKSLRFNSADTTYLSRSFSSSGNRKTWTYSCWVKLSSIADGFSFITQYTDGSNQSQARITGTNSVIRFYDLVGGSFTTDIYWSPVYRDLSAWYHLMLVADTTQATNTNRIKLYVNGVQVTSTSSATWPSQNTDLRININSSYFIGQNGAGGELASGYMTEVNFIDGQALTPSSFGMTDPQTGAWVPVKYTGTYGTNGFYLNFKDATSTSALGYDYSGNSNNWTTNNFSVTAGAGNDSLTDVPTPWFAYNTSGDTGGIWRGNYATWNPLFVIPSNTTNTFANGNLEFTVTQAEGTGTATAASTMALPTTGKWYWEITPTTVATANAVRTEIGIMNPTQAKYLFANDLAATDCYAYAASGVKVSGQSQVAYGNSYTANDVIGVAVDLDNGAIYFAKNGTWQNSGVPTSGASKTGAAYTTLTGSSNYLAGVGYWGTYVANFGQRPFAYTPPAGYRSLCTTNLPTPAIGTSSTTQANDYFNPVLYNGTGATLGVTGVGFQPDFVWIKSRSASTDNALYDIVRGDKNQLESNNSDAETTETTGLTQFNADGFTVGSLAQVNTNSSTYVSWNWKAGGNGVTNTAGSITSTVSANTTAGFSVVTYTGNATAGATVGHGLGVAPSMIIVKNRVATSGAREWVVYHSSLGNTQAVFLSTTGAAYTGTNLWNNTSPTSTVFTVGNSSEGTNGSGNAMLAYCFAPVAGYSAFGSYTGNGSADGPFIYTGFRPRFILFKRSSASGNDWRMTDTARSTYNPDSTAWLYPNTSLLENANNNDNIDILSNGFKIRATADASNNNGSTFIYAAFAESPFKYANAR